jgi:hypothetical protein
MPSTTVLISGQEPMHPSTAAHQRANRSGGRSSAPSGTAISSNWRIPSRGPWLASGLCCPAGSTLTTTSSELLALTRSLMDSRAGPPTQGPASGGEREGPQFKRCVSSHVPSPIPRWTGRLHMAVASPTVIAFANSFMARHPLNHARWFSRGSCHEADTGSLALRPARLLALTNKVRLLSSFRRVGHPTPRRL